MKLLRLRLLPQWAKLRALTADPIRANVRSENEDPIAIPSRTEIFALIVERFPPACTDNAEPILKKLRIDMLLPRPWTFSATLSVPVSMAWWPCTERDEPILANERRDTPDPNDKKFRTESSLVTRKEPAALKTEPQRVKARIESAEPLLTSTTESFEPSLVKLRTENEDPLLVKSGRKVFWIMVVLVLFFYGCTIYLFLSIRFKVFFGCNRQIFFA
jgi:hypothetical protein